MAPEYPCELVSIRKSSQKPSSKGALLNIHYYYLMTHWHNLGCSVS